MSEEKPLVGVCIPAYKRLDLVQRAMGTVLSQTYTNIVIIVAIDYPEDIQISQYLYELNDTRIVCIKNTKNLGASRNTNRCIEIATDYGAEYIKLLFQDDWFSSDNSLEMMVDSIIKSGADILFSANYEVYRDRRLEHICNPNSVNDIKNDVSYLFRANILGAPSNVLYKTVNVYFDQGFTWLLDVDFYLRLLMDRKLEYLYYPAISIGHDGDQLTDFYNNHPFKKYVETIRLYRKHLYLHNKLNRRYLFKQFGKTLLDFALIKLKALKRLSELERLRGTSGD